MVSSFVGDQLGSGLSLHGLQELAGRLIVGLDREGTAGGLFGFKLSTGLQKNGGPSIGDVGIIGYGDFPLEECIDGFFGIASSVQGQPEIIPSTSVEGVQANGVLEGDDGVVDISDFVPCQRQFVLILGFLRCHAAGCLQFLERFTMPPSGTQDNGQLVSDGR